MMGTGIQQLVEQALTLSEADGCIVIGEERTEANLRWAANSLTTNGQIALDQDDRDLGRAHTGRRCLRRGVQPAAR